MSAQFLWIVQQRLAPLLTYCEHVYTHTQTHTQKKKKIQIIVTNECVSLFRVGWCTDENIFEVYAAFVL